MTSLRFGGATIAVLALTILGCATTFEGACHELTTNNRMELTSMVSSAKRASYERHVILLETGTEMDSKCRSYHIGADEYHGLPNSLQPRCHAQGGPGNRYCLLYSVDGQLRKERLF